MGSKLTAVNGLGTIYDIEKGRTQKHERDQWMKQSVRGGRKNTSKSK